MKHYTVVQAVTPGIRKVFFSPRGLLALVLAGALAGVLGGCSTPVLMQDDQPMASSPYEQRQDALGTLLNQAWKAREAGRLEDAESTLGRAMRISPTAPDVYYQLALLRQDQGRSEQSRQLAGRALSLGPGFMLERKINHLLRTLY